MLGHTAVTTLVVLRVREVDRFQDLRSADFSGPLDDRICILHGRYKRGFMYMVHDSTQNKTGYHESTNIPLSRGPGEEVKEKTETFSLWQQETGKKAISGHFL